MHRERRVGNERARRRCEAPAGDDRENADREGAFQQDGSDKRFGSGFVDGQCRREPEAVQRRGVKRLVIDGISGFQQAAIEQERMVRFWSVLLGELRALGVTTLHTIELPELMGTEIRAPLGGVSSLSEVWFCCATSSFSRDCTA